ncbi:hypothetical protein OT109_03635 [Phycisphaeraceae bacterium D3-23]
MTASVDFFCTANEELQVFRYLTKDACVEVYDAARDMVRQRDAKVLDDLPEWHSELKLFFLHSASGQWVLHTTRPDVDLNANHDQLVASLIARDRWDHSDIISNQGLIDFERSPALVYIRGQRSSRTIRASQLVAYPSRLASVSIDFERWVKRVLGWVRRKGEIVHDYRTPSCSIPNPDHLLTTTYALPEAKILIDSGNHPYEIGI